MAVNKFIFRAYPDFLKRIIILIVSLLVCVILSYFIPGWGYLNTHLATLESYFGKYIPMAILLLFYFSLFLILYIGLFNRFSRNFYISATNNNEYILSDHNQNETLIRKEDIQFISEKTFRIKNIKATLRKHPKGISVDAFRQYLNEIKNQQAVGSSFSGIILPMSVVYLSLAVVFVLYIAYSIILFKLLQPHIDALQMLFRAKSPLFMIMISIPFMAVFFLVMYYMFQQTVLRKQLIKIDWSPNQITASVGSKKYDFKKSEVKTSVFFINRLTHLSKWLIIEQKKGTRYIVLNKDDNNTDYQEFINSYIRYFDIDIENTITTIGSSGSILMKKKYTHE